MTNKTAGDFLMGLYGRDYLEQYPYSVLTFKIPSNNNDLWGLVDVTTISDKYWSSDGQPKFLTRNVLTMKKELLNEKRPIITLVFSVIPFCIVSNYCNFIYNILLKNRCIQNKNKLCGFRLGAV